MLSRTPVDFTDASQAATAVRVARAWRELRRGAAMGKLRSALISAGSESLEPGQIDTLDLIAQRPQWRMSELADALRVDPSTATRAVQRLEKVGLAVRQPCDLDGRVVMVSLTDHGKERHDSIAALRRGLLGSLLAEFDPAEREQLAELLDRFVGALDNYVSSL